jgi:alpha-tubulin suppressor-like RCC1 family protein
MPASNQPIIDNINCKLTTGGLTDQQAAQLAGAAQALSCSTVLSVACCSLLPSAASNKGRFVYLQDIGDFRYSNGSIWTDNYCSAKYLPNLWTWGLNNWGQLGDGTTTSRSSPGTVAGGGTTWCAASAGNTHTAAVKTDGTLWTWGNNGSGQLGDGTATSRSSPVTVAGGGTTWCAASAGNAHTAAVKTDGTLWTWGFNGFGRLGDGTATTRSSPVTVAGGGTNWCAASAGGCHTAAVKTDGTLWTWGLNSNGQLGDGTATSRSSPVTVAGGGTTWCAASAGNDHAAAVKTDGTLWTWGFNGQGRLGDGTTTSRSSPVTVAGGGTNWCAASAGNTHTAAVKTDGTLWTWGNNGSGQLGDGTTTSRLSPGTVAGGGTTWCAASAGLDHTAAVKTDGTLWTWGSNGSGRLGDGTTTNRSSPGTTIGGIINGSSSWSKVSAGGCMTFGIVVPTGF